MEVGDTDVGRDIRVLTVTCLTNRLLSRCPCLWLLIRKHRLMTGWETTLAVVPFVDTGVAVLRDGSILNLTVA